MTGSLLLDTSILAAFLRRDPTVDAKLENADQLLVPAISLGELYYGAYRSGSVATKLDQVDKLAARSKVLDCDAGTALEYGRIKNELRARGRPIPENDLWIAALARQHELTVATRDRHFHEVEGLPVEDW